MTRRTDFKLLNTVRSTVRCMTTTVEDRIGKIAVNEPVAHIKAKLLLRDSQNAVFLRRITGVE